MEERKTLCETGGYMKVGKYVYLISGIAAASGQVGCSVVLPAETSALEPRNDSGLELFEEVESIPKIRINKWTSQ